MSATKIIANHAVKPVSSPSNQSLNAKNVAVPALVAVPRGLDRHRHRRALGVASGHGRQHGTDAEAESLEREEAGPQGGYCAVPEHLHDNSSPAKNPLRR
jgi:hypothetical protein